MQEISILRQRIARIESEHEISHNHEFYPDGLVAFPGVLSGQGFFPGGDGLWRKRPTDGAGDFPKDGIMILGNDFGCLDNPDPRSPGFIQCLRLGYEEPPTWNIKEALNSAGIQVNACFFTNAYLGLRTGIKSKGPSPGKKYPCFRTSCIEFLASQIEIQRPRLIVCLGHEPRLLAASLLLSDKTHPWKKPNSFQKLDRICSPIIEASFQIGKQDFQSHMIVIAHPSYSWSSYAQYPRHLYDKSGEAAEHCLLTEAWTIASKNKR